MFYTNSKHLNCCDNSGFECHNENIAAEEMVCTTIIEGHEKNFQPTHHYIGKNINKTLVSSLASLIALSTLEGAGATEGICDVTYHKIMSKFCNTAENICRLISINEKLKNIHSSASEYIEVAFDYSSEELEQNTNRHVFNYSIPLTIPRNHEYSEVESKLNCGEMKYINDYLAIASIYIRDITYSITNKLTDSLCISKSTEFCSIRNVPQISTFSKCCPDIESYVVYPGLSIEKKIPTVSDTVINAITESTTAISSDIVSRTDTILNPTAMEKTLPIDNNISILTTALVVILPLTLIIFSALGYRTYKSRKSHNPQTLPKSDNVSNHQEEIEDLV